MCVIFSLRLHNPVLLLCLSVLLHLLCHGNPIRQADILHMCKNAARNSVYLLCGVHNLNVDQGQIKFVFRVRTNLIRSMADSPQIKCLCVCVKYLF